MKDYKTNPFFKIKVDLLLQELEKEGMFSTKSSQPIGSYQSQNLDTLKSSIGKENQIYRMRLQDVKKCID
jgi:hypothetical protein